MARHTGHPGRSALTRRRLLERAPVALAAAGLACLGGAPGAAARKVPQKAVNYQDTPMDGKRCAGCAFFQAPDACERVEGEISPEGWCALWSPKQD